MHKKLTLHSGRETLGKLGVTRRQFPLAPRFDIAPGQMLGAVVTEGGQRVFRGFRWGLIPSWWTNEQREKQRLFTARVESLTVRPAFMDAVKSRRALIPVDGFWVWHDIDGELLPFYFKAKSGESLYLAAIWEEHEDGDRLALVSTVSNRLVEPLSSRMPAVLRGNGVDVWLNPNLTNERAIVKALNVVSSQTLRVVAPDAAATGWRSLEDSQDSRERLALVYGRAFKPEKPRFEGRRRLVRRDHLSGGQIFFRTKSFTREDATNWHPIVDTENGQVFCDCPDFRYRHAHHEPDVWTPQWWCKHVSRAVANCKTHGELPVRQVVVRGN